MNGVRSSQRATSRFDVQSLILPLPFVRGAIVVIPPPCVAPSAVRQRERRKQMPGSETPQSGWWRASDGLWYPPESLPSGWFIDLDGVAKPVSIGVPTAPPPFGQMPLRDPLPARTPTYTQP